MLTLRTVCLAALALAAASPAAAQINITIGRPRHPLPPYIGTIGGYRPLPPVYRPPIGVITPPRPPWRPVPPVVSLRPMIYPSAYLSRFAPGYETMLVGNVAYYYYPTLPPAATFVPVGGQGYYQAGDVWFQPYTTAGRSLYLVVPPPF
jgi:hypothetical protein